jgi:hypothetical protein
LSYKNKERVNGLITKDPREGAPDWIHACLSFKVDEFITYLKAHEKDGWVNIDIKRSKEKKKLYPDLNDWNPGQSSAPKQENSKYDYNSGYSKPSNGPYGSAQDSGPQSFEDDIPF